MGATMYDVAATAATLQGCVLPHLEPVFVRDAVFVSFPNKSRMSFYSRGIKAYVLFGGDEKDSSRVFVDTRRMSLFTPKTISASGWF